MDFQEIIEKIKDILSSKYKDKKIFDKDVANELNINHISFATMKSRNKIPYKEVLEFCAKKKISINWLMFNQVVDSIKYETEKFEKLKYFTQVYASAGAGAEVVSFDEEELYFDKSLLKAFNTSSLEVIKVSGESMEPTLNDGDLVFIDRNSSKVNSNNIYVVNSINGIFIKRVKFNKNKLVLISDNKLYEKEEILLEDANILGKVVAKFSTAF